MGSVIRGDGGESYMKVSVSSLDRVNVIRVEVGGG